MQMSAQQIAVFLLSISIMLFAAKFFGEILNKLKQPAIVGEMLAGIILGPTIFGYLIPGFSETFFPQSGLIKIALDGITTLAVVMLLLVSGLEVDLSMVIKQGRAAITTSVLGIIIPFVIGFAAAYYSPDLFHAPDNNRIFLFALFAGTALSISALPVIAKTLVDLNIFKTPVGLTIISAAMFNDVIGWLIFSIILSMMDVAHSNFNFMQTSFLIFAFIVILFIVGRKIINRILPYLQTKISYPGGVLNFIFILGFLGAAFTEYIGVHAIFGAFLVGVAIGDSVHLKEHTREVVQQFVNNIFAPLFFVSIGLRVNFITNFDPLLTIIVLVLSFLGKIIGCTFGAKISGFSKREALMIGFGMNSRGAMEIILGILALQIGLISEAFFVALVSMALLTSLTSGPVINALLRDKKTKQLFNFLSPKNIIFTDILSKDEIIYQLIEHTPNKINKKEVLSKVMEREEAIPTGIANYLAIPHARVNIDKPIIICAVNKTGLPFSAFDETLSKIIFLLLTPENKNELQLQLLADISKKFQSREKVEQLFELDTPEKFYSALKKL